MDCARPIGAQPANARAIFEKSFMNTLEQTAAAKAQAIAAKQTFFRQSSWMMISSVAAGAFMFAVHFFFSDAVGKAEYGIFGTLLSMLANISIPGLGLQMVFAQQTVAALTEGATRQLTGTVRGVLLWTLLIWIVTAAAAAILHLQILTTPH